MKISKSKSQPTPSTSSRLAFIIKNDYLCKMRRKQLLFFTCLIGLLACGDQPKKALADKFRSHDFEVNGIYYKITSNTSNEVEVTYKGRDWDAYKHEYSGAVVIPNEIIYKGKKYTVTEIGYSAFKGCSKMTSITIPPSVQFVGPCAFSGCHNLKEIHVDNLSSWCELSFRDLLDYVGESPLYYVEELYLNGELITDLIIPEDVTEIGSHAFEGYKNLRRVVLHKDIVAVHKSAFLDCENLTDVQFLGDIDYIGAYAFNGTSWYEDKPDGEVYIGKLLYQYKGEMPLNTSVIIKDGTEVICQSAFDCHKELVSITLPSSLKYIHNYAFGGCTKLKEIYCKALTPPDMNHYYNDFHDDATIYVPKGTREIYSEKMWFFNVVEMDFDNPVATDSTVTERQGLCPERTYKSTESSITADIPYPPLMRIRGCASENALIGCNILCICALIGCILACSDACCLGESAQDPIIRIDTNVRNVDILPP